MVSPFQIFVAAARSQSQPPSRAGMLVWLAMFIIFLWGALSGWLARSIHSMWAGTWLLPGVMSDLPTLMRIYRWFGVFLLLLACVMCIAALFEHFRHGTPTI